MGLKTDLVLVEFGICPKAYLEQCRNSRDSFSEGATPSPTHTGKVEGLEIRFPAGLIPTSQGGTIAA